MVRLDHVVQAWLRSSGAPRTSLKEAQRRVRKGEFSIGGEVAYEPKQQLIQEKLTLKHKSLFWGLVLEVTPQLSEQQT